MVKNLRVRPNLEFYPPIDSNDKDMLRVRFWTMLFPVYPVFDMFWKASYTPSIHPSKQPELSPNIKDFLSEANSLSF